MLQDSASLLKLVVMHAQKIVAVLTTGWRDLHQWKQDSQPLTPWSEKNRGKNAACAATHLRLCDVSLLHLAAQGRLICDCF